MSGLAHTQNDFLSQITLIIEKNISNEQFGVSELADEMNMSRSNLLRRVKKETRLSVSQLISQVRLKHGMELLQKSAMNVSEVSHQVGFSSTSYFIKCFREFYGYPPGEVGKRATEKAATETLTGTSDTENQLSQRPGFTPAPESKLKFYVIGTVVLAAIITAGLLYFTFSQPESSSPEKSIAVLPFKNDSNDSSNIYLINGLMEATLNNLQQIKDLKVISRTSVEKYRNTAKSIPEIAAELGVNYFVEGSGQKMGDRILLNIQLIEASTDRHLWANQYRRDTKDIFELQQEIAKNIANEIQVLITPEEKARIEKIPTDNLVAYDFYLKGKELLYLGSKDLEKAIPFFKKAIELDEDFAHAYASVAFTYYYLDIFKAEKKHEAEIGSYADRALLYDAKLAESLMAKALSYIYKKEYEQALPYLEKALEYNPNSALIIGFLSDFYANYLPNTAKYLEYSLMGVRINIGSTDSVNASFNYLRMGNALVQCGFVDESLKYIDKSLAFNPQNPYSRYVRAFILYAAGGDLNRTRELLIEEFNKDSTRFDILQDIGKVSYYMRDYEGAYQYYKKFIEIRETRQLDVYRHENLTIGIVLSKVGLTEKSEELIKSFKSWVDNDRSIYRHLGLAGYYIHLGDTEKAIEHMRLFAKEDNYQYWVVLFFKNDPACEHFKDLPEFRKAMHDIDTRFWDNHKKIKATLEEKGLI